MPHYELRTPISTTIFPHVISESTLLNRMVVTLYACPNMA